MTEVVAQRHRAHEALDRHAWLEAYEALHAMDPAELTPDDLEALGDAAWWTSHLEESITVRQRAYAGHAAVANDLRAGFVAGRLCIEHFLLGEPAVAGGWLMRAQRHLGGLDECDERGFLNVVESHIARFTGDPERAISLAGRATSTAERSGNRDLLAMAIHSEGLAMITAGRVAEGLALLDEAMTSVIAGELSPYYTGAVYCNVIEACLLLADLGRARQWSDAAVAWGNSLPPSGALYPGLCRVNQAEVAQLLGDWDGAVREAERGIEEIRGFALAAAAPAYVTIGDVHRRRGDHAAAEAAYGRARELGHDAQPGLALLRLAQSKVESAGNALQRAIDAGVPPLRLVRLLSAQVQVELSAHDHEAAEAAAVRLEEMARELDTPCLRAAAATAVGTVSLGRGRIDDACRHLAEATAMWRRLRMPYEAALAQEAYGRSLLVAGDEEDARGELTAAADAFEQLGAAPDADRVRNAIGAGALPGGLTAREAEVLRLVASGKTNRDIAAELVISDHTVARHLQNMFAKLDVSSRSAATAWAFEHGLA